MITEEDLRGMGFKGLNLNNMKWFGFDENKAELVTLNKLGVAKTYKFKRVL